MVGAIKATSCFRRPGFYLLPLFSFACAPVLLCIVLLDVIRVRGGGMDGSERL